jgi:uncharacterized membrane protein
VNNAIWRKRLSIWRNRLYLYPAPDPLPHTRMFWLATGVVALLALLFSAYFIFYLTGRHDAFLSNAEDMGIMDQAIWNTVHGQLLHQTICNVLHDTNCYSIDGISRFAIHFEPILFPVSFLYLLWPGPKTLLVIQTLIVASGAFPAFWLARLRLRNEWAGVAIALLYLLYPAQQFALVNDFHAVTFTASFLLFTLYFMYTRRTAWLIVFAILAMACKEEIPVLIALYGLWSIVFQRRWRSALALIVLAMGWLGLTWLTFRFFSPTGHPLLASRYAYLGHDPLQIARNIVLHPLGILKQHVLDHSHNYYLRLLLNPAGYLPLLAPWVFVLALPTLALNLLSSDQNMYSGLFQYNAEIVPVVIFSTIEAIVLIIWLTQWLLAQVRLSSGKSQESSNPAVRTRNVQRWVSPALLAVLLAYVLFSTVKADTFNSNMPFGQGFHWPATQITAHTELAQRFIGMIPQDASVSAQSSLAPHISERPKIYLFPYADDRADYIFLDVSSDVYPFYGSPDYTHEVKKVLQRGNYGIVAAQDGYLLLKRGVAPPAALPYAPSSDISNVDELYFNLSDSFCTYISVPQDQVLHPLGVTFGSSNASDTMDMIGYSLAAADTFSLGAGYMQITTYWQVSKPTIHPLQTVMLVTDSGGGKHDVRVDVPSQAWCPTNTWKAGHVLRLTSRVFSLSSFHIPNGLAHISIALLPVTHPFSTIVDEQHWLPLHITQAPATIVPTQGANALQLGAISIVP